MPAPPDWLYELAKALTEHLVPAVLPAPLGAHIQQARFESETADDDLTPEPDAMPQGGPAVMHESSCDEVWEISIFYGKTEIVGGPDDGRRTETTFWLDVAGAQKVLTRVDRLYWQTATLSPNDDLGSHFAIEGDYLGHPVRVRILAVAPRQFPPARTADTIRGMFIDLW